MTFALYEGDKAMYHHTPYSEDHLSNPAAPLTRATAPLNEPAGYADELKERAVRADREWADDESDEIPW